MEPIKVLYVYGGIMAHGGIETFMMNNFREMDSDKVHIDFVVHGNGMGIYDQEILEQGSKIYHVPIRSKNPLGNYKEIKNILLNNDYLIVHSHMDAMNSWVLKIAEQCGVPIRISHSHNTDHLTNNKFKYALNEYAKSNIARHATHLMACSESAGRWLYGEKTVKNNEVTIVPNAISTEKYKFHLKHRTNIRREFNLKEKDIVIGHIGRFDYQKNHAMILDIFKEIVVNYPDAKLLLVGVGHLKSKIMSKIRDLNLTNNVIFTGNRNDVPALLSAMDLFLFPSLFEGLGIVLIEAQANGLPCLVSTTVPKEVEITNLVTYENLDEHPADWAKKALDIIDETNRNLDTSQQVKNAGYDINASAKKLEEYYYSLMHTV